MNGSLIKALCLSAFSLALVIGVGATNVVADPILDAGWAADQIDQKAPFPSGFSPYDFTLTTGAFFRITDEFIVGDQYFVADSGTPILTTSLDGAQTSILPIGDPFGDSGWTSALFQHGQVYLLPGAHSLVVTGDGVGGLPAGFYARLDTPEPSTLALLGLGLGLLALSRRRR